jgi:uncharacterized protein (DUF427 family)
MFTETRSAVRYVEWPRRVRAMFAGETIADSTRVRLLLEPGGLPVYQFPPEDVQQDLLVESQKQEESPSKGSATYWQVRVADRIAEDAAYAYSDPPEYFAELAGWIAFNWSSMDAWFEEDDEVFAHPKSPFHRVDVLNSSRHVRIDVDGVTIAESVRPRLLFETGLPTRYYLPKIDVRMDLMEPSARVTQCPYKGFASHLHARVGDSLHENVAWVYPTPLPESSKIENLVAFYNERTDIYVDGELQERPNTKWSKPT